jgi:hypothetical protein
VAAEGPSRPVLTLLLVLLPARAAVPPPVLTLLLVVVLVTPILVAAGLPFQQLQLPAAVRGRQETADWSQGPQGGAACRPHRATRTAGTAAAWRATLAGSGCSPVCRQARVKGRLLAVAAGAAPAVAAAGSFAAVEGAAAAAGGARRRVT